MERVSINELTTYRWSLEEDVTHYAAQGIRAIGVWRQKLADFGEEKGIELLAEHGLEVSNLFWAGGFTGSDGRSLRESLDDAREAIELAAALKAGSLIVYTGSRAGHTRPHARRLAVDALRQLVPWAEDYGVTLAVEPMHPECAAGWTFLTSLADTLDLLDVVDHPRVQLALDTYQLGFDPQLLAMIPELVARTAIVHLGDGHLPRDREQLRSPLGQGEVPLVDILSALESAGYAGFYDVELIGPDLDEVDYRSRIIAARQFCEAWVVA